MGTGANFFFLSCKMSKRPEWAPEHKAFRRAEERTFMSEVPRGLECLHVSVSSLLKDKDKHGLCSLLSVTSFFKATQLA